MLKAFGRQLGPSFALTAIVAVVVGLVYPFAIWGVGQAAFRSSADGSFIKRDGVIIGAVNIGQGFTDKEGNPLPQYFQPRPSATSPDPYNASSSSASNLGPSDPRLVGFIPGFNTLGLNGLPSPTNPFATKADPYCVPMSAGPNSSPVNVPGSGEKYAISGGIYVCDPNTVPERALAYRELNHLGPNVPVPVDAVTASGSGLDPGISIANADLQAPRVASAGHLALSRVMALIKAHTIRAQWGFLGEPYVNVLQLNLALDNLKS
ncbi:MAG TPA: potassium-transporting ATPase subunit C [Acidimicrobiales bacterium]|nr:potassium-transporting ATPase subunit C [Acidimicrobiales bacterium]